MTLRQPSACYVSYQLPIGGKCPVHPRHLSARSAHKRRFRTVRQAPKKGCASMLSFSKRKRSATLLGTSALALVVAATLTQAPAYASPASAVSPGPAAQLTNPYSPSMGHTYRHGAFASHATNTKIQAWNHAS